MGFIQELGLTTSSKRTDLGQIKWGVSESLKLFDYLSRASAAYQGGSSLPAYLSRVAFTEQLNLLQDTTKREIIELYKNYFKINELPVFQLLLLVDEFLFIYSSRRVCEPLGKETIFL